MHVAVPWQGQAGGPLSRCRCQRKRISVIGDVILARSPFSECHRLSEAAPFVWTSLFGFVFSTHKMISSPFDQERFFSRCSVSEVSVFVDP